MMIEQGWVPETLVFDGFVDVPRIVRYVTVFGIVNVEVIVKC